MAADGIASVWDSYFSPLELLLLVGKGETIFLLYYLLLLHSASIPFEGTVIVFFLSSYSWYVGLVHSVNAALARKAGVAADVEPRSI